MTVRFAPPGPHKTVLVHRDGATGGTFIHIDEAMAPLIEACWAAGIGTSECCQEPSPSMARIGFERLSHMERFFDLLAPAAPDDRILLGWQWSLWADGGLYGTVHFPAALIPEITQAIQEYAGTSS